MEIIIGALLVLWVASRGRRIELDYHPDADLVRRPGEKEWKTVEEFFGLEKKRGPA